LLVEKWWQVDDWRRRIGLPVGIFLATVAVGALIGSQLGIDAAGTDTSSGVSRLEALAPGTVTEVPEAKPEKLDEPLAIGSQNAGLAVLASSVVDSVETPEGRRRAPDGGTLVVFKVGDWGCETEPCKGWTALKPSIRADSLTKKLPLKGDTFVIALPPGTGSVRLVVDDAGYSQSVSLLDDDPGSKNVALLAQPDATKRITVDKAYRLTENTDIQFRSADGSLVNQFIRNAVVDYAQRRFFYGDLRPQRPRDAFLVVSASYTYPGRTQRYAFSAAEATFIAKDGTRYAERGTPIAPGSSLLSFEIPASVRSGTLVLGGSTQRTASNGVPYTSDVTEIRLPLTFG
jgi:hypothetical protein